MPNYVSHNDHLGAWYMWPLKEDTSNVGREEIVKLNDPIQDIVSAAGSVVRITLHFDETDIDNARKFGISARMSSLFGKPAIILYSV